MHASVVACAVPMDARGIGQLRTSFTHRLTDTPGAHIPEP